MIGISGEGGNESFGGGALGALGGEVHEVLLGAAVGFVFFGVALGPGAVGGEVPGLAVVGEHDVEDFAEAGLHGGVVDGDGGFDAVGEVAGHPVGGAHVVFARGRRCGSRRCGSVRGSGR